MALLTRPIYTVDLNSVDYNFFGYVTGASNKPSSATTAGFLISIVRIDSRNYRKQFYSSYNSSKLWIRTMTDNVWSNWQEINIT